MTSIVAYEGDAANRVVLNIGGTRFETCKNILKKIPATRLSRLNETLVNYDPICNEYFFDRHPGVFSQILNYYRTGKLHYPNNVCGPLFESELEFWGLDSNQVEPCCWKTYTKHRATEETLTTLDRLNIDVERTPKQDLDIKFGLDVLPGFSDNNLPLFKRYQPIVWQLFEEPRSSNPAKVVALVQVTMIVLSIVILWITTYPFSRYQVIEMQNQFNIINTNLSSDKMITSIRIIDSYLHPFLVSLEYITLAWFLIDFIIRFTVSPDKSIFMTQFNNVIDIIASLLVIINPFIQAYIAPGHDKYLLQGIQVVRVLRLVRLLNYHPGLRVIILSIQTSTKILRLLVFFILVAATLFGSLIFYAERLTTSDQDNNLFLSVIEAVWYSVVSLTTIGYGDIAPTTLLGRLFGSACAVCGALMVSLPMTIVVEIFTNFYKHLGARSKLPKQRRRVLPVEAPRTRKKQQTQNQDQQK
jgi:potassium voltage-gated channel Shaw-related subfamily C member 1